MSYPETVGTPPLPEKFFFIADIREPRLCIASALTEGQLPLTCILDGHVVAFLP